MAVAMNLEKVKANIRAMLNLANDPAAARGEIDNAMRFVAKLMAEHQLDDSDLSEVDDKVLELEKAEMGSVKAYSVRNKTSAWETSLASFICALIGGLKYYYNSGVDYRVNGIIQMRWAYAKNRDVPVKRTMYTFYGIAEDAAMATELFNEVAFTIASMAKLKYGQVFRKNGRDYCEGFVAGLWNAYYRDRDAQLKLAQQGCTNVSKSTALVAIDSRALIVKKKTELAEAWLEGTGVKLKSGAGFSNRRDSLARKDGFADGRNHSVNSERRKKLPGA